MQMYTKINDMSFWKTKIGAIMSHGIHEHNSGLGYIINSLAYIKKQIELGEISIQFKNEKAETRFNSSLGLILKGKEKCKDSVDYIYTSIKKETYE